MHDPKTKKKKIHQFCFAMYKYNRAPFQHMHTCLPCHNTAEPRYSGGIEEKTLWWLKRNSMWVWMWVKKVGSHLVCASVRGWKLFVNRQNIHITFTQNTRFLGLWEVEIVVKIYIFSESFHIFIDPVKLSKYSIERLGNWYSYITDIWRI